MNFIYKLEKKFGKYAVNNLSAYIVGGWAIGYILWLMAPKVYNMLIFDISYIFAGHQFWRIFTWVFTMPGAIDVFTILMLFVYYSIGTSIERYVGTFMYNIFIFGGLFFVSLGMLIDGAMHYFEAPSYYNMQYAAVSGMGYSQGLLEVMASAKPIITASPTYFMSIGVFLGFALIHSDSMMLLLFVFPVKTKWLAYADLAVLAYYLIKYSEVPLVKGVILAVVINFYLFYLISKNYSSRRMRNWKMTSETVKRQKEFKKKMEHAQVQYNPPKGVTRHKCAICGRTESDDENLEFRFCSRCSGNHEYCNDHLFTHEHVK